MEDNGRKKVTIGCAFLFVLFLLYFSWPLLVIFIRAAALAAAETWPIIRIPVLVAIGAWVLWMIIKRASGGSRMSYERIQRLVWNTGARYAQKNGLGSGPALERRFEAPGYTVSDFIDRYGISPQMDRELIREYRQAFRK